MSKRQPFTEQFKLEAVKQVVERGFGAQEVAARLRTSPHSLNACVNKIGISTEQGMIKRLNSKDWNLIGEQFDFQFVKQAL